ncbi:MAG: winged helix-turn-helix transcriptional regulator [Bacteroidetes bacterium]|nr:winged helix-turn-helix transcriptional regulator [Bacteroidota bacterium]
MERRRDVYQALADQTRRDIIHLVAGKPMTPNAIAGHFDVSRQAVSNHLQVLTECGLIVAVQKGRERYYEVRLDALVEVVSWIEQQRQTWTARFDKMDKLLKSGTEEQS